MTNYYLSAGELQQELINKGDYTLETVPPQGQMEYILEVVQTQIDNYLGYNLMRQIYVEPHSLSVSNFRVMLKHPNVSKIIRVTVESSETSFNLDDYSIAAVWNRSQTIDFQARGNLFMPWHDLYWNLARLEIEYEAGLTTAPRNFQMALTAAIAAALKHGVEFLAEPVADVQSIGMAGVSKSIRLGKGVEGEPGTNLERILGPYIKPKIKHYYF
jgi:hypothetical protein